MTDDIDAYMVQTCLSDYSRDEFRRFVELLEQPGKTEAEDSRLVRHFSQVVPHPAKSGLIFWPEPGADDSPEGVVTEIERYCHDNGLPGFKDS